jgi:hypothetical protein
MKTVIQFSTEKVNYQKNSNLMKVVNHSKIGFFTLLLFFFSFNACQKDAASPAISESIPMTELKSEKAYPIDNITPIYEIPKNQRLSSGLQMRGELADIEDVPVVTSGSTINCHGTPEQCLIIYLENLRFLNAIKPGQRLGIYSSLSLHNANVAQNINNYTCYRYISEVGIRDFCGYIGKDKDHPFNIKTDGNYRIQLTPKNTTRNLDLFVYKLEVKNGEIDTTLVAFSTLPAGKTETIHLTKKGYYTIVVDERVSNSIGSDYILAVSGDTRVKTIPILQENNELVYQFALKPNLSPSNNDNQLVAWSFQRKINGVLTDLGYYPVNSTFNFLCETCDYLVAPVYAHKITGKIEEEAATLLRP